MIKLEQESRDYINEIIEFTNSIAFENLINQTVSGYEQPTFVFNIQTRKVELYDSLDGYNKNYYLKIGFANDISFKSKVDLGLDVIRKDFISKFKQAYSKSTKLIVNNNFNIKDILSYKVPAYSVTRQSIFKEDCKKSMILDVLQLISEVRDNFGDDLPVVLGDYAIQSEPFGLRYWFDYFDDDTILKSHLAYLDTIPNANLHSDVFLNRYSEGKEMELQPALKKQTLNHITNKLNNSETVSYDVIKSLRIYSDWDVNRAFIVDRASKLRDVAHTFPNATIIINMQAKELVMTLEYSKSEWSVLYNTENVFISEQLKAQLPLVLRFIKDALAIDISRYEATAQTDVEKLMTLPVISSSRLENGITVI